MWPFSRKPEPSNAPDPAPVTPQVHFDWKAVPSIQRTAGEHPLTVPTESFAANLATQEDPRAVAKPLGHEVSLAAPPGIVLGIARTQTRSDGPDLVPGPRGGRRTPVQRVIDESVASEPQAAPSAPMDVDESAAPPPPPRRLPASTGPLPSVQLMRVSPETEPTPLEPEIVTPSEEPPAAAAESSPPVEETTALPSYPRLTLGQARRLGLGAPMRHVPETATSVQRISEVPTSSPDIRPHPISAESTPHQISGVQEESKPKFEPFILDYLVNTKPEIRAPAPISRPQRIPLSVSRSIAPEPPEAASAPTSEQAAPPETVEESTPDATAAPAETPAAVQRAVESEVDDVPVQLTPMSADATSIEPIAGPPQLAAATDPKRTLLADAPEGEAGEGEGEAMPPLPLALDARVAAPTEMSAAPAENSIAPIISDRAPLFTKASSPVGTAMQRITDSAAPVQRSTESTGLSAQRAADTAPATGRMTSEAPLQRVLTRSAASVPDLELRRQPESSRSLVAGDWAIASTSPMTTPSFASALPLARPPQPVFAGAPPVQRSVSMEPSTGPAWSSVQTSSAVLEPESDEPSVSIQRAPVQEWTVSAAAEPESSGPSLVAGAEAGPSIAGADDEEHMDDLAAKLYDRIRNRLRNELLVDRERAGFLTDLR